MWSATLKPDPSTDLKAKFAAKNAAAAKKKEATQSRSASAKGKVGYSTKAVQGD
jgi:hypothetical protein